MSDEAEIHAKLDYAAELMSNKNMAIIDELWSEGFRLVGSEDSELANTREGLIAQITKIFAKPLSLHWAWDNRPVIVENDIAWVFATGRLEFVTDPGIPAIDPLPYRLVAIFRRVAGGWQWRLYSGSEPQRDRK